MGNPKLLTLDEVELGENEVTVIHEGTEHRMRVLTVDMFIKQQKRQKERQKLLDSVKKGDKIVTVSGMHGTVVGVEDKTLLIQAAEGIKLKYDRTAIASVTREAGNETTPS